MLLLIVRVITISYAPYRGGADSDIVIDICNKIDKDKKIKYVWFDTGIEYQATKDHLEYLENKYDVEIIREKAIKPVPIAVKEYGQPFLSKYTSEWISRLQRHKFDWKKTNISFEKLLEQYSNCKAALKWWCNKNGKTSKFSINYNQYLKDFMICTPPKFLISNKCCDYAKKNVIKRLIKKYDADLSIYGVRKAEGGARSTAYKNCFTDNSNKGVVSQFRPIFYFKTEDRKEYEKLFNIKHSKCYTKYGLKRTGCVGCPYGKDFEEELRIIEKHEPRLFKAVNNIFKESYEYTRQFKEFKNKHKKMEKSNE